jgi:DNA polymerase-3 subunit epsilon
MGLGKLKNKSIDTDDVSKFKGLQEDQHTGWMNSVEFLRSSSDRHTAIGDAYITALIFAT